MLDNISLKEDKELRNKKSQADKDIKEKIDIKELK